MIKPDRGEKSVRDRKSGDGGGLFGVVFLYLLPGINSICFL